MWPQDHATWILARRGQSLSCDPRHGMARERRPAGRSGYAKSPSLEALHQMGDGICAPPPPFQGPWRDAGHWVGRVESFHERLWRCSPGSNPFGHLAHAFGALSSGTLLDANPCKLFELHADDSPLTKKKKEQKMGVSTLCPPNSRPLGFPERSEKLIPSWVCADFSVDDIAQQRIDPHDSTLLLLEEEAPFKGETVMSHLHSAAHCFSTGKTMLSGDNPMPSPPYKLRWKRPRTFGILQGGFIARKFRLLKRASHHEKQCPEKMSNTKKKGNIQVLKQLLCGGFAGVISRTAVAPFDLIKTHLITAHLLQGVHKSALTIYQEILQQDGWRGLFRGNTVNCIRVAPSKAIELCVFEMVRRSLNKEGHPLQKFAATVAGGAAGMAGTIATYPLELLRTRLSVQPELYKGLVQAVSKIAKEEGIGAFYYGLSPTLVGVLPYAATNYFVYDGLRTVYCQTTGHQNVPTLHTLLFGALAAAMSSSVTYPLEVARRQMQLGKIGFATHKNTLAMIEEIFRHEGFLALYRGLGTTWLKLVPAAGISFVCYEAARIALKVDEASLLKLQRGLELDCEQETV